MITGMAAGGRFKFVHIGGELLVMASLVWIRLLLLALIFAWCWLDVTAGSISRLLL